MIRRYSKLTMENMVVCKPIDTALEKYDNIAGIKPYHHIVIANGIAFAYIWDTRKIEVAVPESVLLQEDLTYAVQDNRMDLLVDWSTPPDVFEIVASNREDLPVMFLELPLTEDEQALLDINHY